VKSLALALLLTLAMSACELGPPRLPEPLLDAPAPAADAEHVVVTVRNAPSTLNPYAASTLRGYSGQGGYRVGAEAISAARRIAQAHGLREVAAWPIELLGVHCLVYAVTPGAQPERVLTALRRDPDVESAQPLSRFELRMAPYNDPYAQLQANLDEMGVRAAQQWTRGSGVRIAVVDTGVDTVHPDFGRRLARVRDFVADGRTAAEPHGTAVAGIIAAVPNNGIGIAGIAPEATLLSLRACWSSGSATGACNSFTLAQALAAAIAARAQVINLSLGGPGDALLSRIVDGALARGVVVVGAVPASGRRDGFPTNIDGVIAVDAAARAGREPRVLYAPGSEVFTLTPLGRYDVASGSSVAAAEVSAVAALLLASQPGLGGREVEALLSRSTPAPAARGAPHASVNACAALRGLKPSVPCAAAVASAARRP
jgi:subtilisin family serine protease